MNIQPNQNKLIHALLNSTGMMQQKKNIIMGFTGGRSDSSKGLTYEEAGAMLVYLKSQDAAHKMRRKIIKLAHEIDWKKPGSNMIDLHAIDNWCKKYGYGHKGLNEYTTVELPKLVTQFENGPYRHYLSTI